MKTRHKPDLIIVLVLFVGAGVLFSSYGNGIFAGSDESADLISASSSSDTAKSLYIGNFIKVSTKNQAEVTDAKDTGKQYSEATLETTANQ